MLWPDWEGGLLPRRGPCIPAAPTHHHSDLRPYITQPHLPPAASLTFLQPLYFFQPHWPPLPAPLSSLSRDLAFLPRTLLPRPLTSCSSLNLITFPFKEVPCLRPLSLCLVVNAEDTLFPWSGKIPHAEQLSPCSTTIELMLLSLEATNH